MKPHEQTWHVDESGTLIRDERDYRIAETIELDIPPQEFGNARLIAQAPAMARLLLKLQWAAGGSWGPSGDDCAHSDFQCFVCDGLRDPLVAGRGEYLRRTEAGHAPDCALIATLRAAGVVE